MDDDLFLIFSFILLNLIRTNQNELQQFTVFFHLNDNNLILVLIITFQLM